MESIAILNSKANLLTVSFTVYSRKHVFQLGESIDINWFVLFLKKTDYWYAVTLLPLLYRSICLFLFSLLYGSLIVKSVPSWQWEYALHVQTIKCWHGAGEKWSRGPWPYMLPFTCPCAAFTMCTPSSAPFHTQAPYGFHPHTPPGLYLHWCDPKWYACQRDTRCFSHLPSTPFGVLLGVLHHNSVFFLLFFSSISGT